MALATLSVDLVANLARFEQDLGKAARASEQTAQRIDRAFGGLKAAAAGLASAFAGVSLVGLARGAIDSIDALNDLRDSTGSTIENLSALEDIARRNGAGLDLVAGSLTKFNSALREGGEDNGVARALRAIGLDAAELRRLDPSEALHRTAQALNQYADDGHKARLIQELFGRSAREVAPFLKDLAEQTRLVGSATSQQAEAAERFNKQLAALTANASHLARALVNSALPALTDWFESMEKVGGLGGAIRARLGLDEQGQLESKAAALTAQINRVGDSVARMSEELSRDPENARLAVRVEKARTLLGVLQRQAFETAQALKGVANRLDAPVPFEANFPTRDAPSVGPLGGGKTAAAAASIARRSEFEQYMRRLEQTRLSILDLTEAERARIAIVAGELGKLTSSQERQLLGLAEAIDAMRRKTALDTPQQAFRRAEIEATDATNAALAADRLAAYNDARERFNALLAATPSAQLEQQRADMLLLADAYEQGRISVEQFNEAVHARLQIGNLAKPLEEADEFTRQAARNVQDTLGESIARTLRGDFKSLEGLWADTITRMAAEATAAQLGRALLGDFAKTGQLGGWIGEGVGWLKSAIGGGSTQGAQESGAALTRVASAAQQTTDGLSRLSFSGIASAIAALFNFSAATTTAAAAASASTGSSGAGILAKLANLAGMFGGGGGGSGWAAVSQAGYDAMFAEGGFTGHAGVRQPVGVVHGQEYVFSAPAVRSLGVPVLEHLHRYARAGAPRMGLQGYADGGYVRPLFVGSMAGRPPSRDDTRKGERPVVVNNTFHLEQPADTRTQSQIAALAAAGIRRGARNL